LCAISLSAYFVSNEVFDIFLPISPELNPVAQCGNQMKNVLLAHFVSFCIENLVEKTHEAAQIIHNDPKRLTEFFPHAT